MRIAIIILDSRYLPENGWRPYVLTIKGAKDLVNDYKLLDRIPKGVKIYRTNTIDFLRWRLRRKHHEAKIPANLDGSEVEVN